MQTAAIKTNANMIDVGQGFRQQDYLDYVHGQSQGYIAIGEKRNKKFMQWHYKKEDLCDRLGHVTDTYYTPNTFYKAARLATAAKEINMFYVDLDYYNTSYTRDQVLLRIYKEILPDNNIPTPTFVIDSGRGLYLQWQINKAQGKSQKVQKLWRKIQMVLLDAFDIVGADRSVKDIPRYLRVPGSINSKNGQKIEILDFNDVIYDLNFLQFELLPDFNEVFPDFKSKKPKKKRNKKVVNSKTYIMRTPQNLHYTRLQDLEKVVELRGGDIEKGIREVFLFYYRYLSEIIYDNEVALRMTQSLNNKFRNPLKENEVKSATKSTTMIDKFKNEEEVEYDGKVMRAGYNYKNSTLIELYKITEKEQESLATIIDGKEKQRRNTIYQSIKRRNKRKTAGLTPKQKEIHSRRVKVRDMRDKDYTRSQIADELDVSLETVKRDIKAIRNQSNKEIIEPKQTEKTQDPSLLEGGVIKVSPYIRGYVASASSGYGLCFSNTTDSVYSHREGIVT